MNDQSTTLWLQAQAQAQAAQAGLAAQTLQALLAQQPNHADAAHWLAWLLHDQGEFVRAYRWARQALALGDTPQRRLQVGWLLQCQGRYEQAVNTYEMLLTGIGFAAIFSAALAASPSEGASRRFGLFTASLTAGVPGAPRSSL